MRPFQFVSRDGLRRQLQRPRGVAMILTLVVMSSLLLAGMVATGMRLATLRGAGQGVSGQRAYYCAEAGLVAGRNFLRQNSGNWDTYLSTPGWSLTGRASLDNSSLNYTVTVKDDFDEIPTRNDSHDSNGTILMTSTCTDPTLATPTQISRYMTILPVDQSGVGFNPGAVTYTSTSDFTGKFGATNAGGINAPTNASGGASGTGSGANGSGYVATGVSADGVDLRNDQISLSASAYSYQFLWMSNSGEGTVTKIDTVNFREVGRYRTGPAYGNPSRTTVDLDGNVWVANRDNNTITKIGLVEKGNCIDRNSDGVITTSTGGADVKNWTGAWGTVTGAVDECILFNIKLTYPGVLTPFDVRGLTVSADGYVMAGSHVTNLTMYKINATTGAIVTAANTPQGAYGAVSDANGYIWTTDYNGSYLMKIKSDLTSVVRYNIGIPAYGIAIDQQQRIWASACGSQSFIRINNDGTGLTTFTRPYSALCQATVGTQCAQGITVDPSGNVWIAGSLYDNAIDRFDSNGNFLARYTVGSGPTGVAVDAAGKIWTSNYYSNSTSRIDPSNGNVATLSIGTNPYNYSDMTGYVARSVTVRQGTWSVRQYCDQGCTGWRSVAWNANAPGGTQILVQARVANSVAGLGSAAWFSVNNGVEWPKGMINGRIIEVQVKLTSNALASGPTVYDVTITPWLQWSPDPVPPVWSTGFESGNPQGVANNILYSKDTSSPTCAQVSSPTHAGSVAYQLSANATAYYSFVYCLMINSPGVTIANGMKLRYWIYHTGVPLAAVDGLLSDGQTIRDYVGGGGNLVDAAGIRIHPSLRQDLMGQWYYVTVDLSKAVGKSINYLMLTYDTGGATYASYPVGITAVVDDISIGY